MATCIVSLASSDMLTMQLKTLAAENAALRTTIAEREQKEQHDLQDMRNFCIASQEQSIDKDSSIHAELQQHQQELAGRMSTYEASAMEFTATTRKISSRLDTVSIHQWSAAMCMSSPAKCTKLMSH
jgi:predicted RNase H-like nuclease (RuvC/YqgF family)